LSAVLSIFGLAFDLIGVLILGFDVLSLQKHQRSSAKANSDLLRSAFEGGGSLNYIGTYVENTDNSDQLFRGHFQVDGSKLSDSLDAIINEIEITQKGVDNMVRYLQSSVAQASDAAGKSLCLTYLGLGLIVIGFFLQGIGVAVGSTAILEIF
jgi:hypothetical protein